jgi:hypothetical protein
MKKLLVSGGLVCLALLVAAAGLPGEEETANPPQTQKPAAKQAKKAKAPKQPNKAAIERTRDNVKMLDDVYKQAIVLITDKYVHDTDDFAAGSAAVAWFQGVSKTGYHTVRLIDATGQPYEEANVAKSDFEKEGLKQLKAGKGFYDEVVTKDGKPYLLALTAVPVVHKKCVMCHDHYADAKEGEPIGAISYEMPIR